MKNLSVKSISTFFACLMVFVSTAQFGESHSGEDLDYGKMHNEIVVSVLESGEYNSNLTIKELLALNKDAMLNLYPQYEEEIGELTDNDFTEMFDLDQLMLEADFFNSFSNLINEHIEDEKIANFVNDALKSQELTNLDVQTFSNELSQDQQELFRPFKEVFISSGECWSELVPVEYQFKTKDLTPGQRRHARIQRRVADAAAALLAIGMSANPFVGLLASTLASELVASIQNDNFGGGPITG